MVVSMKRPARRGATESLLESRSGEVVEQLNSADIELTHSRRTSLE